MKPNFALLLDYEGIELVQRVPQGWRSLGTVRFGDPDRDAAIAALIERARVRAPGGMTTKLVIPEGEVRYVTVYAPGPTDEARRYQIEAEIDGLTPYALSELAFDWVTTGDLAQVAIVARETLREAEEFAVERGFNPVSFVARPTETEFYGEPFFGETGFARTLLGEQGFVEPDLEALRIVPEEPGLAPGNEADIAHAGTSDAAMARPDERVDGSGARAAGSEEPGAAPPASLRRAWGEAPAGQGALDANEALAENLSDNAGPQKAPAGARVKNDSLLGVDSDGQETRNVVADKAGVQPRPGRSLGAARDTREIASDHLRHNAGVNPQATDPGKALGAGKTAPPGASDEAAKPAQGNHAEHDRAGVKRPTGAAQAARPAAEEATAEKATRFTPAEHTAQVPAAVGAPGIGNLVRKLGTRLRWERALAAMAESHEKSGQDKPFSPAQAKSAGHEATAEAPPTSAPEPDAPSLAGAADGVAFRSHRAAPPPAAAAQSPLLGQAQADLPLPADGTTSAMTQHATFDARAQRSSSHPASVCGAEGAPFSQASGGTAPFSVHAPSSEGSEPSRRPDGSASSLPSGRIAILHRAGPRSRRLVWPLAKLRLMGTALGEAGRRAFRTLRQGAKPLKRALVPPFAKASPQKLSAARASPAQSMPGLDAQAAEPRPATVPIARGHPEPARPRGEGTPAFPKSNALSVTQPGGRLARPLLSVVNAGPEGAKTPRKVTAQEADKDRAAKAASALGKGKRTSEEGAVSPARLMREAHRATAGSAGSVPDLFARYRPPEPARPHGRLFLIAGGALVALVAAVAVWLLYFSVAPQTTAPEETRAALGDERAELAEQAPAEALGSEGAAAEQDALVEAAPLAEPSFEDGPDGITVTGDTPALPADARGAERAETSPDAALADVESRTGVGSLSDGQAQAPAQPSQSPTAADAAEAGPAVSGADQSVPAERAEATLSTEDTTKFARAQAQGASFAEPAFPDRNDQAEGEGLAPLRMPERLPTPPPSEPVPKAPPAPPPYEELVAALDASQHATLEPPEAMLPAAEAAPGSRETDAPAATEASGTSRAETLGEGEGALPAEARASDGVEHRPEAHREDPSAGPSQAEPEIVLTEARPSVVPPANPRRPPQPAPPAEAGTPAPELGEVIYDETPRADPALAGFRPQPRSPRVRALGEALRSVPSEAPPATESSATPRQHGPTAPLTPGQADDQSRLDASGASLADAGARAEHAAVTAALRPLRRPTDRVVVGPEEAQGGSVAEAGLLGLDRSPRPLRRPEALALAVQSARALERARAESRQAAPQPRADAGGPAVTANRPAREDGTNEGAEATVAGRVAPGGSPAFVAQNATERRALRLRDVNLIGVFGTGSNRRALVRMPNGEIVRLVVGDRFDGGQVTAIGEDELRYMRGGRDYVLKIAGNRG